MAKQLYEIFDARKLSDETWEEAAQLFNENYGIWGTGPAGSGYPKSGNRVKLSKKKLQAQCLPDEASCSYVRVTIENRIVGHAFACRWSYRNQVVCWITQLVVHRDYRERGLAVMLLMQLRQDHADMYGLMSSHPAACLAASKAFGGGMSAMDLNFLRQHARGVLDASPVTYIKDAQLRGSLFDAKDENGAVCSADSRFFVDHSEPFQALTRIKEGSDWPLGELLVGHEFLVLMARRRRS